MIPFDLTTRLNKNKSKQFSSELSRNVYYGLAPSTKKQGVHDWPGLLLVTSGSGVDRGDHVMAGVRYLINGTTLYSEDINGTRTSLGTIPGSGRAVFEDDGTNLYIVADNVLYKYNGSLSTVTQSAVSNPTAIAYINNQFILAGSGGLYAVSDVNDGDTYQTVNAAEESTKPDSLLRPYVFNSLIYMCGSDSIVPWYNSGVGNPPLTRQETSLVNYGLAGVHAVTNSKNYLYALTPEKQVIQIVGSSARVISTEVDQILDSQGTGLIEGCIASAFKFSDQWFVMFKFGALTLLYSETFQYWVELGSGTDKDARAEYYANSFTFVYGKLLGIDHTSGNTYELDPDTYTDNSDTRLRILTTRNFTSKDIRLPRRQVTAKQASFEGETGVGLETGQGVSPVLMCQFSEDGGKTWGQESQVSIGALGDYEKMIDFWAFATGYEIKIRIMISDPVFFSLYGGYIDLVDGGH